MDQESNPDENNLKLKPTMQPNDVRNGGLPGLRSDSIVETSTSECPIRSGHPRRHSALDPSLPRVHSSGRTVDGLSTKASQPPDLINNHQNFTEDSDTPLNESPKTIQTFFPSNLTLINNVPSAVSGKRRNSEAVASPKLNVPGNSVIVTDNDLEDIVPHSPHAVLAADKLQPYPPGSITIVKEGPPQETPSSLMLASMDKELEEAIQISQARRKSSFQAHEYEYKVHAGQNGVEAVGCHCRLALEGRLQSAFATCMLLKDQMEVSDSKCARWEQEAGKSEENVANLQRKVAELDMELSSRNASLQALKAKVAQQHVDCDELKGVNRKIERDYQAQVNELDRTKKSEKWYREQYHSLQSERSTLQKQLMSAEEEKILLKHRAEKLESELKRSQDQFLEMQEQVLKDKQKFTRRLEMALVPSSHTLDFVNTSIKHPGQSKEDPSVTELQEQLQDLKVSLNAKQNNLASSEQEIQRLLSRSLQLQRELSNTKICLQEERDRFVSAAKDRDKAEAELKERSRLLAQVSQENSQLTLELQGLLRERSEQANEVQTLTRNFTNVSSQYRHMKAETQRLQQTSSAAQEELRQLRADRDSLKVRLEESARREQAAQQALLQLQLQQRQAEEVAGQVGQLEHQVLATKESLEMARAGQKAAQQRADELEQYAADRAELAKHNEQLQLQVDSLSQLLQENTGSRLRAGGSTEERSQALQEQQAQLAQLRAENAHLHGQVQKSSSRLIELTNTLQDLELEMAALKRGEGLDGARVTGPAGEGDGDGDGDGVAEQPRVMLSASPIPEDEEPPGVEQLTELRDANNELTLYAAALERRLERLGGDQPDLVSSSEQGGEEAGLLALLRVCLTRTRTLVAVHGGEGDGEVDGEVEESEALPGIRRCLERLTASVEQVRATRHSTRPTPPSKSDYREDLVRKLLVRVKDQVVARKAAEQRLAALEKEMKELAATAAGDAAAASVGLEVAQLVERVATLEQELAGALSNVKELHKQLFSERRDASQLRKEVASLRLGLETANDMLDNNKIALGRTEAYGEVLKVSKEQLQARFEKEQREHEDCRQRLEQLAEQLQAAQVKDPLLESQIKTLGCHLHQRAGEVRALQGTLSLRDQECADLRSQLERQKAMARREYEALQQELQQAQREFSEALKTVNNAVPDPMPCDEEGLSALIQESNRLSPAVLDELKSLLYNMKAELKAVEQGLGYPYVTNVPVIQEV